MDRGVVECQYETMRLMRLYNNQALEQMPSIISVQRIEMGMAPEDQCIRDQYLESLDFRVQLCTQEIPPQKSNYMLSRKDESTSQSHSSLFHLIILLVLTTLTIYSTKHRDISHHPTRQFAPEPKLEPKERAPHDALSSTRQQYPFNYQAYITFSSRHGQ